VPMDLSINSLYPGTDEQVESEISGQYEGLARQMRVQAESYLRQVAERLRGTGARIDILVQVGKAADVIVENAADLNVDAIVMATHGRSGISRWLLGSVTQKVLSAAPCPVYVIPSRKR
jgi:nucleotide-binding universal stress UspA family protein